MTTPPLFRGLRRIDLRGATAASTMPDAAGRSTFKADLGASGGRVTRHGRRVCARSIGGPVEGRFGAHPVKLTARLRCRTSSGRVRITGPTATATG